MKKQKLFQFKLDREYMLLLISMILVFSIYGFSIYKSVFPPIKEITFKVFDVVEYSDKNRRIHPYGRETFNLFGELDIEIIIDDTYYLKYREIGINRFEVIEIMRLS